MNAFEPGGVEVAGVELAGSTGGQTYHVGFLDSAVIYSPRLVLGHAKQFKVGPGAGPWDADPSGVVPPVPGTQPVPGMPGLGPFVVPDDLGGFRVGPNEGFDAAVSGIMPPVPGAQPVSAPAVSASYTFSLGAAARSMAQANTMSAKPNSIVMRVR